MSTQQKPRLSDMHRERHRLLLAAEVGQKADIQTYISGHLGPHSLTQKQPPRNRERDFWPIFQSTKEIPRRPFQRRQSQLTAKIQCMTTTLVADDEHLGTGQEEADDEDQFQIDKNDEESVQAKYRSSLCEEEGQQRIWFSHSHPECMPKDQPEKIQSFGRHVIGKQGVWKQHLKAGTKNVEMHERKLQKGLEKLSAQSWPSRDHLAVFSDVFDDVCDGSPVFGGILREIKTDLDLYINYIIDSQSSLLNKMPLASLKEPNKAAATAKELEQVEREISRLEEETKSALEANVKVRSKLQAVRAMKATEERDLRRDDLVEGVSTLVHCPGTTLHGDGTMAPSAVSGVQVKRLQVWNLWNEIQKVQKDIKEMMVPVMATAAIEKCLRDTKAEIIRITASNDRLKISNEDLESNVNVMLKRMKGGGALRRELWDNVWSTLPPEGE